MCSATDDPSQHDRPSQQPAAPLTAEELLSHIPATFPLDEATFLAGLDSPNHSPESRRAWVHLFFRDMLLAAERTRTEGLERALRLARRAIVQQDGGDIWIEADVLPAIDRALAAEDTGREG